MKVGLITKAIDRVEKDESPPAAPETPTGPKRKKRIVIATAILLFLGISLGLGYLFLLKPETQAPPETTRRAISTRRRPPKPAPQQAQEKRKEDMSSKEAAEKATSSSSASKVTVMGPKPDKERAEIGANKTEELPSEQTAEGLVSEVETQPETLAPPAGEPEVDEEPQAPEEEEQFSADTPPPEGTEKASGGLPDEAALHISEETPLDGMIPPYLEEMRREWTQKQTADTERSDSRAERYYNKGVSYHQQGELNRAIDSYKEALTFNPEHLPAHTNLATAYVQTGRFKEAEQELVYLYALRPRNMKVLFNLGFLLYQIGEYVSAETKLKKLLELEPLHLEANLLLASIYEKKGELDKALEFCIKAYQVNSVDPRVLYRLGRAWDMADEPSKAAKYYRLYLNTRSEKEKGLESAVRDRLDYLVLQKEGK
jgi:Flp pilus assembly protein TadD